MTHPDIAEDWHPTRNRDKTPYDFTYGSHHEATWQCPRFKSHVYTARISSRTSMLSGCPICARKEHAARGRAMRKKSGRKPTQPRLTILTQEQLAEVGF